MPTYDYTCNGCKHGWEEFQSMSAAVTKVCPKCKKRKARRLIGAGAGLIFKGSGFYVTDYKKKPAAGVTEGSGAGSAASSESGAGGGEKTATAAPAVEKKVSKPTTSE